MSALAEALVAAQADLPCALGKDADGQIGQRSYRYLTLDKLIAETCAAKPATRKPTLTRRRSAAQITAGAWEPLRAPQKGRKHDPVPRLCVARVHAPVRCQAVAAMTEPYPKERQLARGERRYRRKVASAKQWQRIIAAKQGPCRVCRDPASNGSVHAHITFHHLVPRAQGGDDCADNIVPLCSDCHGLATLRNPLVLEVLARHLLDSEYAYIVDKLGESGMERLFGVGRS